MWENLSVVWSGEPSVRWSVNVEVDRDPSPKNVECWAYSVDGSRLA